MQSRRFAVDIKYSIFQPKIIVWLLSLIMFAHGAAAMSFFNPTKTCVFSEVSARLTLNGEPLRNMTVTREWNWHKRKSDKAITDSNGHVSFPAVYESSVTRLLPAEIVIGQRLSIEIDGETTIFWQNAKRESMENSEYGGSPFNVTCELTEEKVLIEDFGSLMATMCKLEK